MRIAYRNIVDGIDSGNITCSTADPNFPVSNIQDQRLSMYTLAGTTAEFVFDFTGHGYKINTVALLGHNISSSASIYIYFNYINDWANPAVTQVLTWNKDVIMKFLDTPVYVGTAEIENANELTSAVVPIDNLTTESGNLLITEAGDSLIRQDKYAFAKVKIVNNVAVQLGRVWMGDYLTISPSSLLDFKVYKKRSDINIYGKDRQKFSIPGVSWRAINLKFPPTDNTMLSSILDWFDMVGLYRSFIFCNFDTLRGYALVEPLYCSISSDIGFTHQQSMKFSYELNLEEDK